MLLQNTTFIFCQVSKGKSIEEVVLSRVCYIIECNNAQRKLEEREKSIMAMMEDRIQKLAVMQKSISSWITHIFIYFQLNMNHWMTCGLFHLRISMIKTDINADKNNNMSIFSFMSFMNWKWSRSDIESSFPFSDSLDLRQKLNSFFWV